MISLFLSDFQNFNVPFSINSQILQDLLHVRRASSSTSNFNSVHVARLSDPFYLFQNTLAI